MTEKKHQSKAKQPLTEDSAKQESTVRLFNKEVKRSDLFKFLGLIGFFVLCIIVVVALLPLFKDIVDRVIERIQDAGAAGVLVLLALQFIQVVVAFIPGEVTQMAAGMLYGPLWGSLLILFGCAISSAFVYELVHRLGAPFVKDLISDQHLKKFQDFEKTGRLNIIVFILFLIPGLPKDTFTYIVPLTDMKLKPFVAITTIARSPGIILSAYAAEGLLDGRLWESVAIFAVLIVLAIIALIFSNRIMEFLARHHIGNGSRKDK